MLVGLSHYYGVLMDRPGVRQVPEDDGEQKDLEEIGCEMNHL